MDQSQDLLLLVTQRGSREGQRRGHDADSLPNPGNDGSRRIGRKPNDPKS